MRNKVKCEKINQNIIKIFKNIKNLRKHLKIQIFRFCFLLRTILVKKKLNLEMQKVAVYKIAKNIKSKWHRH